MNLVKGRGNGWKGEGWVRVLYSTWLVAHGKVSFFEKCMGSGVVLPFSSIESYTVHC